jgi:hypothetical protein
VYTAQILFGINTVRITTDSAENAVSCLCIIGCIDHPYKSRPHLSQTGSASDFGFLICCCICGKPCSNTSLNAFDASASSSGLKAKPFKD